MGTLYLRTAVQRRGQRPPKGVGTNWTVEATYSALRKVWVLIGL